MRWFLQNLLFIFLKRMTYEQAAVMDRSVLLPMAASKVRMVGDRLLFSVQPYRLFLVKMQKPWCSKDFCIRCQPL
jgi:hypothetical protein